MAIVFEGKKFSVEVETRRFPDGQEHEVEIVRHPAVVVMIPIDEAGCVVFVRQYRAVIERETWELPAGGVEPNEDEQAAVRRECAEELALMPGRLERLGTWYSSPGFCDELMTFYRITDLRPLPADSPHKPDPDEIIAPRAVSIADARAMVARGEIVDLKTAYALTLV
jgi:ADP-ribose pyrophosphatase